MIPILLVTVSLVPAPPESRPVDAMVRLSVRPMAAPKPALKYQLLPEVRELQAGNAVQWYLRCFMEQRNFFFVKESIAERTRYQTMPLKDLPADKLKGYGGSACTQADWAARLDSADWQVLDRVQNEGADMVLPEISSLRLLAAALQVRFRGEVARREFDAAIGTAKTMLALARHLGEHPTSTANLIGISIADMALDTLEEMVQLPGCPNLYWAFTDLPTPLVDLRKGVQGDRALAAAELRPFREDLLTDTEIDELIGRLSGRAGFAREQAGQPPRNLRARLAAQAKDADRVRAARARLIESGCKEELVAKFQPMQIILLDEKRDYEGRRDEEMKLLNLASWQIDAQTGNAATRRGDGLFADLLPRVVEVRRAQARLEQRIALLRHVEALRLHAAAQGGKFPENLSDIEVPLPTDPFTGKPFAYKLDGPTARLRGAAPKGEEKNPAYNLHYEITIPK